MPIFRTTKFILVTACFLILFAYLSFNSPFPEGGQNASINCGKPDKSGKFAFKLSYKWMEGTSPKESKTDNIVADIDKYKKENGSYVLDEHGNKIPKDESDKAKELADEIKQDVGDSADTDSSDGTNIVHDHDGDEETPEIVIATMTVVGSEVIFMPPDPNPNNISDLKIKRIDDKTGEEDDITPNACAGYSALFEVTGDVTGYDSTDGQAVLKIGLDGVCATIYLQSSKTRHDIAVEIARELNTLGFTASVVRDTIVHVTTPSTHQSYITYKCTDRGLALVIDIDRKSVV